MAMPAYEYELEAFPELEYEWEGESEGDFESEEFFGALAGLARQAIQSPTLRRAGLAAARTAMSAGQAAARTARSAGLAAAKTALGGLGPAAGGFGEHIGDTIGTNVGDYLKGLLPDSEFEGDFEWESDGELNPLRRVNVDALMEHLGHAAAQAQSEAEAEAFLGAAVPLAAQLIPRVAPTIMRAAPGLIRGVAGVARTLLRSPTTRPLVRMVPSIIRGTAANIAQQAARGQPMSPQAAVRTLARQTAQVLSSPQRSVQAFQRSRALDQRYHRAAGTSGA